MPKGAKFDGFAIGFIPPLNNGEQLFNWSYDKLHKYSLPCIINRCSFGWVLGKQGWHGLPTKINISLILLQLPFSPCIKVYINFF